MNDYYPLGEADIDDIPVEDDDDISGEIVLDDDLPDFIPDDEEVDNTKGSEVL
jgi:hypothetical protein